MQLLEYSQILNKINDHQFLVVDSNIKNLYPDIAKVLERKTVFYLDDPERDKNLDKFSIIVNFFLEHGITRDVELLAIGGGATSDLAGFVASSVLRGIKWSVIPTSLLAMIDASIGGKTGVNTVHGKNLVGSFHLPQNVFFNAKFLDTLPRDEYYSGLGELMKYGFLSSKINQAIHAKEDLESIILKCAEYKQQIVENDFKESGRRKILNLGHTFGHAIEKHLKLAHGIAVYWGLQMIIDVYCPSFKDEFKKLSEQLNIKAPDLEKMNFEVFIEYLGNDKKRNQDSSIDFILIDDVGDIKIKSLRVDQVLATLQTHSTYSTYFESK